MKYSGVCRYGLVCVISLILANLSVINSAVAPAATTPAESVPTAIPSSIPSASPSQEPNITIAPSTAPTVAPTIPQPTAVPTSSYPTIATDILSFPPSSLPSAEPTLQPNMTMSPTSVPTSQSNLPSSSPTATPTGLVNSTFSPTLMPSASEGASNAPTAVPTAALHDNYTEYPSSEPSAIPTGAPIADSTSWPTVAPTTTMPTESIPTAVPSSIPTAVPSSIPSASPSQVPNITIAPSTAPTMRTEEPTNNPTRKPTHIPTHSPTPVPTPRGDSGYKWWYYTTAVVNIKMDNVDEAPADSVAAILTDAFHGLLDDMLSSDMSMDMVTVVSPGDQSSRADEWQVYSLKVWTVTHGSLTQVMEVLWSVQADTSLILDPVNDAGLNSVSSLFLTMIIPATTEAAPPSWKKDYSEENPVGIVWIIFLTVIIFGFGVCAIAAFQRKCSQQADPFTYRAPRSISSILCPCLDDSRSGRSASMARRGGRNSYTMESSDDDIELRPENSTRESTY